MFSTIRFQKRTLDIYFTIKNELRRCVQTAQNIWQKSVYKIQTVPHSTGDNSKACHLSPKPSAGRVSLNTYCTRLFHTAVSAFSPVKYEFSSLSTPPITTSTIYINIISNKEERI